MTISEENEEHFKNMNRMLEDTTEKVEEFLRSPSPWDVEMPIQK